MLLKKLSDQELVGMYIEGNEACLETLIIRHRERIYSSIFLKIRNKDLAEDFFQDTFIKVIKTLRSGRYNEEGKFLPWVLRIAHNLVIDHFRKSKKMKMVRSVWGGGETDEYDVMVNLREQSKNIEENLVHDQIYGDVKQLIYLLPDDQKEVLLMRHYYKMSFKEISETTNVSINTALGRMRYALMNLRKIIEEKKMDLTIY